MCRRTTRTVDRAEYAAVGRLFDPNTVSRAVATGVLVSATVGEGRGAVDAVVEQGGRVGRSDASSEREGASSGHGEKPVTRGVEWARREARHTGWRVG